jgi:MFS family permease
MSTQKEGTRRGLFFAGLYLCEGAPIGFLWWALPTILRERGASLEYIGSLASWLVLPWALKFLWAPFFDTRANLGRWISGAQLLMAASLLPLLTLDPAGELGWLTAALVVHAFAAASQDAAIDALAIRTTPAGERGRLNGWMQVGMLLGRSLFGGGALLARRWIGDAGLVLVLSGGLGVAALGMNLRAPLLFGVASASTVSVWRRLAAALSQRSTWLGLVFAATSGAGFEAVGVLAGPLLLDHGLASKAVGLFFGLPVVVAMAVGAVLGGQASDRFGVRRTVLLSALFLGACVLSLAWLAHIGAQPTALISVLSAVYFGIGLFTASSYALFMALTDKSLGATQFSAFMGATNLCESWSARWSGALAESRGYSSAFALPALAALAALPLLWGLRARSHEDESIA